MAEKHTATEVTGLVLDKLEQYMEAVAAVIQQYGGEAVDLGLAVLRLEAGIGLFHSIFWPLFFLTGAYLVWKLWPWSCIPKGASLDVSVPTRINWNDDMNVVKVGITLILSAIALGIFIFVFSPWYFVGLLWPEAYAVHKFLL